MTSAIEGQDQNVAKKNMLRKEIRAAMKELSSDDLQKQSQKVWDRVVGLPVYQSAKSVGLFLSMPKGEINTDPIVRHAVENGKTVYVPRVGSNFEENDMEMLKVALEVQNPLFHKSWPTNKWKIPEPPTDMPIVCAQPGDIDLLVVPGLAFDHQGNRLGQGKGYYDRFIAKMTSNGAPLPLVAVGLTLQLVDTNVPVSQHDQTVDMVVLPDEAILPTK